MTTAIGLSVLAAILMGVTIIELMPVPTPPVVSDYKQLSTSQLIFPPTASPLPLVADASRIYFNDSYAGRLGLQQLSQAGGEASRVELPFDPKVVETTPLTMNPDGSQLLIVTFVRGAFSESDLWLWPVVGGNPRRLGKGVDAAYSPDGSQLLYANHNDEIYLANPDLSEPRLLATAPGSVYWPRFSPDGRRIRFTVIDDSRSLYEMAADGTGLHRVLPEWGDNDHCCGSWTPDGNNFVFHAVNDYRTKLWAIRERQGIFGRRQSEPVQITSGALDFRRPTIAADGSKIFAIGWQLKGEVVRYDDPSRQFVPMLGRESLSGEWLNFSTDEEWIAYVSHPEPSLWRSRSDGTDRMQLTFQPMRAMNPDWSPDGKMLAFSGETPGGSWKTYLVSADGGVPQPVTESNTHLGGPTWSPDGKYLAFNETGNEHIRIFDIAAGTISDLEGSDGLRWPRWSPDGRHIAAYADASLHLFDVDKGQSEKLVELEEYEGHFWAKDSQHIYYSDPFYSGPDRSLYRLHIGDKTSEKIATVGNTQMAWGMWGPWIGISPEGAPLALRDLSIHHIYALDWPRD
jgi:Tol biopolymer transport system component